jgi:hypothetical protein
MKREHVSLRGHLIASLLPLGSGRRRSAQWFKKKVKTIGRKIRPDRSTHIFVTCFQKSGSTYLTNLLSKVTGFPSRAMVAAYAHCEQDTHEYSLEAWVYRSSVTHQHAKGGNENIRLLKRYNVKPVVQVRDIFDVTGSLFDHIERGRHVVPTGYVHQEYFDMTEDEKLSYIIRIHLPWYFNFFMSWREASRGLDALWVTYEQLFSDQVGTVSRVLEFYGLPVDSDRVRSAIGEIAENTEANRFNVGIPGRGQNLSERHKEAILDLANVWRVGETEMEMIGIR